MSLVRLHPTQGQSSENGEFFFFFSFQMINSFFSNYLDFPNVLNFRCGAGDVRPFSLTGRRKQFSVACVGMELIHLAGPITAQ